MNIAIASNFKANYGGNFIAQQKLLAEKFAEKKCNVIFIFPDNAREKAWCKELILCNNRIIFTDNDLNTIHGIFFIIRLIVKYKVNCIHSNFGYLDIPAAIISLIIPNFINIIHARSESIYPNSKYRYLLQVVKHRLVFKRSFVISVGNNIRKEFENFGFDKKRIYTIENGVAFQRLLFGQSRDQVRKELGISSDYKLFIMMGYDIWIKGVDIVCDAFFELYKQNQNKKYLLGIVVASKIDDIENQIFDKYGCIPNWLRLLPPKEYIGDYYRGADCFISASRTEGFPNSVTESINMKLPVIVSNIEATEWALEYPNVVSFKNEDPYDLLLKVKDIFVKVQNVVDSSNIIKEKYGIERWAEKILIFYETHGILNL